MQHIAVTKNSLWNGLCLSYWHAILKFVLQIKVIGLLELNANNNEEIQREAANIRKSRFLRALARQYVC